MTFETFDRAEFKDALARITTVSSIIAETRQQLEVKLASNFSIFEQINYDENYISRIIKHLLDPRGSHSQGSRFLKAYLKTLFDYFTQYNKENKENNDKQYNTENIENILNHQNMDKAIVRCNDPTKDNRLIDITVTWDATKKKFGIENKLWARDQKNQVSDYLKDLPGDGFLIYLSIENPEEKLGNYILNSTN